MSEPLSGSGTAAALGGATVYGLFTGTDFGIVFGAFAGALFVATMPQALSQADRNDEIYRRQREMKEELNNLDDLRSIRAFDVTQ